MRAMIITDRRLYSIHEAFVVQDSLSNFTDLGIRSSIADTDSASERRRQAGRITISSGKDNGRTSLTEDSQWRIGVFTMSDRNLSVWT